MVKEQKMFHTYRDMAQSVKSPFIFLFPILSILGTASAWSESSYSFEEEQACAGDAFRLCAEFIPDVSRITACMEAKQDQLSPRCAKMFVAGRERHLDGPDQQSSRGPAQHPYAEPNQPYRERPYSEHHDQDE